MGNCFDLRSFIKTFPVGTACIALEGVILLKRTQSDCFCGHHLPVSPKERTHTLVLINKTEPDE